MDIRKTLRTVAALAVLFIVLLVGYRYFGAAEKPTEERKPTLGEAYGITLDNVRRAEVSYRDPELIDLTVERRGEEWWLVAPVEARSEQGRVEDLLRVLERNIRKRIGGDISEYGFDDPQVTLRLELVDGSTKTFLFGNKGVSYSLYVKEADDPDAFLMESWVLDEIIRTPTELRNRRVWTWKPNDVRRIVIAYGREATPIVAERKDVGDRWMLSFPPNVRANEKAVERALEALSSLSVAVFLADGADLADFGLTRETAPLRIAITLANGSETALYVDPEKTTEERVRAALADGDSVYALAPDFLDALPKRPFDWRDRRIADFQRTEAWRVVVDRRGDASYTVEKVTEEGRELWFLTVPRRLKADQDKMSDLLFRLDALEATEILSESIADAPRFALDRPVLTLTIYDAPDASVAATIRFGKTIRRSGSKETGIAVASSRAPWIGLVPRDAIEEWLAGPPAIRDRTLLGFDPINVRHIELRRGDDVLAFSRQHVVWRIAKPVLEQADSSVVDGILVALNGLEVERFLTETPPATVSGLDTPVLTLSLLFKDNTRKTLRFGKKTDGGRYAVLDGDPDPFIVSEDLFTEVDVRLEDVRVTETPEP